jgi:hypothetical protein
LSYGLLRRFAIVQVRPPHEDVFRSLIKGPGEIVGDLLAPCRERELGPAIFMDAARYAARRLDDGACRSDILLEAFRAFFLPQFDALDEASSGRLFAGIANLLEPSHHERLRQTISDIASPSPHAPLA